MRRVWLASVVAAVALVAVPGSAAASTYTNPNTIAIPDDRVAIPYPSEIAVDGVDGSVTRVRVTLNSLVHTFPDDIGVKVVAPNGASTDLMNRVCGNGDAGEAATGQTFTFDDAALSTVPIDLFCPSGTYKPTTDPDSAESFTAPAPPESGTAMSLLNGGPANGSWRLFVGDFSAQDIGAIAGGWTLDLLTDATCSGSAATLTGTAGNDDLVGTEGDDVILGFGGKDEIRGLGGRDLICGGRNGDELRGGSGKDKVVGQGGSDELRGNGAKDKLLGKGGKDELNGGAGNDTCVGGKKDDTAKKCEVEKSV